MMLFWALACGGLFAITVGTLVEWYQARNTVSPYGAETMDKWSQTALIDWLEAHVKTRSEAWDKRYSEHERRSGVLRTGYHFTGEVPTPHPAQDGTGETKAFTFVTTTGVPAHVG